MAKKATSPAAGPASVKKPSALVDMRHSDRKAGFFVLFGDTEDALREIDRFFTAKHRVIVPLTVREIIDEEIARKFA